jgi:hypothetical protein
MIIRCGIALLGLAGALLAQDAGLYLRYGKWSSDIGGEVSTFGQAVDVAKDLALDRDKPSAYGFIYRGQRHRFGLDIYNASTSSSVTLDGPLDFGGHHFEAGETLGTALKIKTTELEYWYPIGILPTFRTGLVLAAQQVKMESRVGDVTVDHDEIIPALGLGVTFLTPKTKVYVDLVLMVGENGGSSQYSGRVETGLDITSSLGIYTGLKKTMLKLEDDHSVSFDMDTASFYVGAHLHL